MKASLPILTAFAIWSLTSSSAGQAVGLRNPLGTPATVATAPPGTPPPAVLSGDAMLQRVLATVDAERSIAAKLRIKIDMIGPTQFGTGIYLQQGRGPQRLIRFDLKLQGDGKALSVQEVSNGINFWVYEELGNDRTLRPRRPEPPARARPAHRRRTAAGLLDSALADCSGCSRHANLVSVWSADRKPAGRSARVDARRPIGTRRS